MAPFPRGCRGVRPGDSETFRGRGESNRTKRRTKMSWMGGSQEGGGGGFGGGEDWNGWPASITRPNEDKVSVSFESNFANLKGEPERRRKNICFRVLS